MNRTSRIVALAVMTALVAPVVPARADERTVRCESRNFRYRYCRADTDNEVRLEREMSRRNCVLWRSWGYDRRGIWVDNGCRAEFRVGRGGGLSGGEKAAIGAVAGAAVIAAIIASRNGDSKREADVPEWAVGHFRGYDDFDNASVEMTIGPDGAVAGYHNEADFTGRLDDNRIKLGADEWNIARDGDGIRITNRRNSRHTVTLWRAW